MQYRVNIAQNRKKTQRKNFFSLKYFNKAKR